MNGYDIDGVLTAGIIPEAPCVAISGRTFAEYDATCRSIAQHFPVYIRGAGAYGDREDAGAWKATQVKRLGITKFFEDDPVQAAAIRLANPDCEVVLIGG